MHTHQQSTQHLSLLKDAETGQRGYLLTEGKKYLEPYFYGVDAARKAAVDLRQLTADNPNQQQRMERLNTLIEIKFDELQETIDLIDAGRRSDSLSLVKSDLGRITMEEIRILISHFIAEEYDLLEMREQQYMSSQQLSQITSLTSLALLLALMFGFVFIINQKVIRPISFLTESATRFKRGHQPDFAKLESSGEIGELEESFEDMRLNIQQTLGELEQAKRRAEDANVAKSAFLANMSHEVRTPINVIYGMFQLLAQHKFSPDPVYIELIKKGQGSCRSLHSIVNDILDYSKIEAGRIELEIIPLNLVEIIETTEFMFRDQAIAKNIGLDVSVPETVDPYFFGDTVRIKQVLLNLVSNAIKFTESGKVGITLDTKLVDSDNQDLYQVSVRIIDTGVGMTEKQVERMFSRFEQADTSTTRKFGGTGLGMPISNAIIQLMGGSIDVVSAPNQGSEFTITLPLHRASKEDIQTEKKDVAPPDLTDFKILIVEDNKINQVGCEAMVAPTNAHTEIAENGKECLDLIACSSFDLILMDIQMPVMGGETACRKIRETDCERPVIALTANVMKHDQDRYADAGFDRCLAKLIEANELYQTLDEILLARPKNR